MTSGQTRHYRNSCCGEGEYVTPPDFVIHSTANIACEYTYTRNAHVVVGR